jgi:hypothetical protein
LKGKKESGLLPRKAEEKVAGEESQSDNDNEDEIFRMPIIPEIGCTAAVLAKLLALVEKTWG